MSSILERARRMLESLQGEIEADIAEKRQKFHYRLEKKKVVFDSDILKDHRVLRVRLLQFIAGARLINFVMAPVIYSLIVPVVILDIFVTVYQAICFRIYRIPLVKRGDYIVMDRKYLSYLNIIQKVNCMYCEYANGVIAYAREVAGRTEWYWCPIKHARKVKGSHDYYFDFIEYGDAQDFSAKVHTMRDKCRACEAGSGCQMKEHQV